MLMLIIPNLSESGCPGFEDVQDVLLKLIYIFRNCILSESGCSGFDNGQKYFVYNLVPESRSEKLKVKSNIE